MSYSARHQQHDDQWVKLPVGGDGVHGGPDSLDDPLMTAREVQPMPQSTPTAAVRSELVGQLLGFVVSQAIYVAATLGIADQLAEGPRSATELAGAVDAADPDGLYRLLRLLAGHSIFAELPGGQFTNSGQSELLREGPGSLRPLAMLVGEVGHPAMGRSRA
jgi:hypothetical protein